MSNRNMNENCLLISGHHFRGHAELSHRQRDPLQPDALQSTRKQGHRGRGRTRGRISNQQKRFCVTRTITIFENKTEKIASHHRSTILKHFPQKVACRAAITSYHFVMLSFIKVTKMNQFLLS